MRIEIHIDSVKPPAGAARVDESDSVRFAGWLGLLGLLSDFLEAQPQSEMAGGERGERHPGAQADLGEDVGDVGLDGPARDDEHLGDLAVGTPLDQ